MQVLLSRNVINLILQHEDQEELKKLRDSFYSYKYSTEESGLVIKADKITFTGNL